NGLIWAYHWLQVGLYEPLLAGRTGPERQTGVTAAVARFRQMLEEAPAHMPRVMPMTPAIAPTFAARYPEAAIVFDNLHGMHDVISDILASPAVPREMKREEILRAAARYRDDASFVMTADAWREMSLAMGVENMGGPVTGVLAGLPAPTVERGAVAAHAGHAAAGNAAPALPREMDRGRAPEFAPPDVTGAGQELADLGAVYELYRHLTTDPVIYSVVAGDSALLRTLRDFWLELPHAERLRLMRPPGREAPEGEPPLPEAVARRAGAVVVRLLADPRVEARVHAGPALHQRWSDPRVQRVLAALRRTDAAPSAAPHRH
ncbi:MAG TPA: hypothetical protein VEW03_06205, partial [Longimicrobiaceae bacterium]|nr:hypothetical protein [Longimicrobiaceae bacterium]